MCVHTHPRFLSLCTVDIWNSFFVGERAVLCLVTACTIPTSPSPTHKIPDGLLTLLGISWGQNSPLLGTSGLASSTQLGRFSQESQDCVILALSNQEIKGTAGAQEKNSTAWVASNRTLIFPRFVLSWSAFGNVFPRGWQAWSYATPDARHVPTQPSRCGDRFPPQQFLALKYPLIQQFMLEVGSKKQLPQSLRGGCFTLRLFVYGVI